MIGGIDSRRRALAIALVVNAGFLAVEVVGGIAFGSLALLADALHMVADVVALALAYAAVRIALRPPTDRHTFGFARAEVLAAQANAALMLVGTVFITIAAVRRLAHPEAFAAGGVLVVGVIGLLVNVGSAIGLARVGGSNLNVRAALWHLASDAGGSLAVIVAALGAAWFGVERLDPIASLLIAALVLVGAAGLLRASAHILLEAAPPGIDTGEVRAALAAADGVEAVHHLHVWTTGSEQAALSAHVVVGEAVSLHDAQARAGLLKAMLAERFGIVHATLEVECHACAEAGTDHA
ncbi:MAG: cation diffusion facilitator family transporter [Actinomycetota bacterium]